MGLVGRGGDERTYVAIHPCVLQDIGPLQLWGRCKKRKMKLQNKKEGTEEVAVDEDEDEGGVDENKKKKMRRR